MRTLLAAALLATALPLTTGAFGGPGPAAVGPMAQATVTVVASCGGVQCAFDPPVVQVAPGDTVVWSFANACHSVTAGALTEAEAAEGAFPGFNAFDSGQVCANEGRTFQHTFGESGLFPYYCATGFHRVIGMHGAVRVQ